MVRPRSRSPLRVTIVRGGGLAGLVMTISVDTGTLAPEDARRCRELVEQARLFSLPEQPGSTPSGADRFTYRLTVEEGDRTHTVQLREEDLTEDVEALIAWARTVPGRQQRVGPPGR